MILYVGDNYTITRTIEDVDYVNLDISRDGGVTYTNIVTSAAISHYTSGSQEIYEPFVYDWEVTEPISNRCLFRVSDSNDPTVFDLSDEFFSIVTSASSSIEVLKTDLIWLVSQTKRQKPNRYINLTNFVPQSFYESSFYQLIDTFEEYYNEMYVGDSGMMVSESTDTSGYNSVVYSEITEDADKISVLEKIYRLRELHDPDLLNSEHIQYFANYLGYNVNVNRGQFGVDNNEDLEKYLRFMVGNLPNWYKIKSTKNSIKTLLFSFGLIGDLVYYYTKDYDEYGNDWNYGELYFDSNDNRLKEDLRGLLSDWYPTSHFSVWFDINKSVTHLSFDKEKQNQIYNAIESVRPINTVFKGVIGKYTVSKTLKIIPVVKTSKSIKIDCGNSDYWA